MASAFMPDKYVQIDAKTILHTDTRNVVQCNLYTGQRCITILMGKGDYEDLIRDGFFIRDGKQPDSAGVLNTTDCYYLQSQTTD